MGKSAPAPPTPVDPVALSGAQTQSNKETSLYNSQLNNPNTIGPNGSVTNTYDPTSNQWTQITTLSPAQQQLLQGTQEGEQTALNVANRALGQGVTPGQMQTSVPQGQLQTSFNPGQAVQGQVNVPPTQQAIDDATHASFNSAMGLLQPQMDQAAEHERAQLVAQGLNPNDAAYQNDMTLFNNGQAQQRAQVANQAVLTGQNEQNTLYGQGLQSGEFANEAAGQQYNQNQGLAAFYNQAQGQGFNQGLENANLGNSAEAAQFGQQTQAQMLPIQEVAALAGGGQVQAPNGQFNPVSVAPTDVLGAYGLNAQQQQNAYQAKLQQQQSTLGGLFQLGSAAMAFM